MPRWKRNDDPVWPGMEAPERDWAEYIAPLNRRAAARLLGQLRVSGIWREVPEAEFQAAVVETRPRTRRRPYSGLVACERIDITPEAHMLAWFDIEAFEKDANREASEVDHARLVAVWVGASRTFWRRG